MLGMLDGNGWEIRIWENMGWHYKAVNSYLSVQPSIVNDNKYYATLGTEQLGRGGTPGYWVTTKAYNDPMEAVINQLRIAAEFVRSRMAIVDKAFEAIGGTQKLTRAAMREETDELRGRIAELERQVAWLKYHMPEPDLRYME